MNPSGSQSVPPHLYAQFDRLSTFFNQTMASLEPESANYISNDVSRTQNLPPNERIHHRKLFLKTRRLFNSLSLVVPTPEGAAKLMNDAGLWLDQDVYKAGELPGLCVGDVFVSETEMEVVGLCRKGAQKVMTGYSTNGGFFGVSVIVSDNSDAGSDVIFYWGNDFSDKEALEGSRIYRVEIRVIRGLMCGGRKVFVYDGLYRVAEVLFDDEDRVGFKFVRVENQLETGSETMLLALKLKVHPLEVRVTENVTLDLSKGMERFPVLLFIDVDRYHDPLKYKYTVTSICPSHVYGSGNEMGCGCVGGCTDNCFCVTRNGGFAYNHYGTLVRGKPLVFECGPHCKCPPTCRNRVTQNGIKNRFEVFKLKERAWGVRSLDLIQAGSFICEYAGVYLTQQQVQEPKFSGREKLIYSRQFAESWKQWGDLSQICSNYVSPPPTPSHDFAMDVSIHRNLACYIRYSSTPNVFVQPVLYDHNSVSFPRLMLFALDNIPPMGELSLDYMLAN